MSTPEHDHVSATMLDTALRLKPDIVPAKLMASARAERRERIASRALQGLLAATPATTQATSNFDQYATRAVRYADALLEALNRSHEETAHARRR